MSRNVKIGIGVGVIALIGLVVVFALVVANLGAIAAWIGFDDAGNLDGRRGAIGMLLNPEARVQNVIQCEDDAGCSALWPIVFAAGFAFVIVTGFAYATLLERRLLAFLQHRVGPNRVGPLGFLQPAADGLKLVFKEDLMPAGADKWVFRLAPMIKVIPILMIAAVIPMGPDIVVPWFAPSLGDVWYPGAAGPGRFQCGHPLGDRHHQHRDLWRRIGRLVQRQQVRHVGRAAGIGADDQLRAQLWA